MISLHWSIKTLQSVTLMICEVRNQKTGSVVELAHAVSLREFREHSDPKWLFGITVARLSRAAANVSAL
jgi:hypothetical protein